MLLNKEKLTMLQNSSLIHGDFTVGSAICYKRKCDKSRQRKPLGFSRATQQI